MTDRIKKMRKYFIEDKKHHEIRRPKGDVYALAREYAAKGYSDKKRAAEQLLYVLNEEKPILFKDERIAFVRTLSHIPEIFTAEELEDIKENYRIHELGNVCNISADYSKLLNRGFDETVRSLQIYVKEHEKKEDTEAVEYLQYQIKILNAVQKLADQYRELALKEGNKVVAESLSQVPAKAPRNFIEALQMFRIIHFTMWCGGNYHNTVGRFDQYMYPYFKKDMDNGFYDYNSALELVEEFFLSFNRDSDLYPGIQQGDNGQSMVLGGLNPDGTDSYNTLSEICLNASLELKLIDPKINLRVHKKTPADIYVLGSKLTKQGLGFPQYSNDDIVIPGLLRLGYEEQDAYNYVVAACWEFIIPGEGMDIPNIGALSFASAVENATMEYLEDCNSYEEFYSKVRDNIYKQADQLIEETKNVYIYPAPFISLLMEGCSRNARDISLGAKYNNYGFHGTGIATAADSLAVIREYVFENKKLDGKTLKDALKKNFEGYEVLNSELRFEAPKMGNDIDLVDQIAVKLLKDFAEALEGKKNDRGGIFRAGTGSAMYYVWHGKDMEATPDGRRKGEGLAANYSPSLFIRCKGPVSIIKSFAKPDFVRAINGGPLTLELHDGMFRNEEVIEKVGMLVKSFIDLGGHQLQLNAVNRDTMLDAQKHPENYRNLIVRVWGWSGYFVELDKEYQDHIIQRMELSL